MTHRQFEIIEAAAKLLTGLGINGLTTKNLAIEMQFSESALYRHFRNKEEIIISLLEHLTKEIENCLSEVVALDEAPEGKFVLFFENQISFFKKNSHFVIAVFSDNLVGQSQNINRAILKMMATMSKYLMNILLEGKQKGAFITSITAEKLSHIIMGAYRLQMFKWQIGGFQFDIKQRSENMVESLLILIKNNA